MQQTVFLSSVANLTISTLSFYGTGMLQVFLWIS